MNAKESSLLIEKQLNIHFETDFTAPKIRVIKDPQKFFNYYTGINRERSIKELIKLNSEVSFYYNDTMKEVHFKKFRRNGMKEFKELSGIIHYNLSDILHEFIHHWQVESGGYGEIDLFDEGCCEISTYVITADMNQYGNYIEYIQILWNMLSIYTTNPIKKYELIKEYNIYEDKISWHNECIEDFLKSYPSVAINKNDFIKQVEDKKNVTKGFQRHCYKINVQETLHELYKVHDYYKINNELLRVFK